MEDERSFSSHRSDVRDYGTSAATPAQPGRLPSGLRGERLIKKRLIRGSPQFWLIVAAAACSLALAWRILANPVVPVFDQRAILIWQKPPPRDLDLVNFRFSPPGYPRFEEGISSLWMTGLVWLVDPVKNLVAVDTHVRILAIVLFLGAGTLLLGAIPGLRITERLLALALLATSRYVFLWLSSELFAAAFLMLFLWTQVRGPRVVLGAIFLALFATAKLDLIFSAAIVGSFLALTYPGPARQRRLQALALAIALMIPYILGVAEDGLQFFSGHRDLVTFSQHYAAFVQPHQMVNPHLNPWMDSRALVEPVFGNIGSVWDAIRARPRLYRDFIFLSLSHSVQAIVDSLLILLLPLVVYCYRQLGPSRLRTAVALLLSGLLPMTMMGYIHIRYLARFFPVALFVILWYVGQAPPRARTVLVGCLVLALGVQLILFVPVARVGYWLPG